MTVWIHGFFLFQIKTGIFEGAFSEGWINWDCKTFFDMASIAIQGP